MAELLDSVLCKYLGANKPRGEDHTPSRDHLRYSLSIII